MDKVDIAVIGAGVVGLAASAAIADGKKELFVFERNRLFGQETSSRNSEVIHSGIYYPEDSLKARTCIKGNRLLYQICKDNGIPFKNTGKMVVACSNDEMGPLKALFDQGTRNGVKGLKIVDKDEINKLEPNVSAVAALYVPSTGIMDSHGVMDYYYHLLKDKGGDVVYDSEVTGIRRGADGYVVTVLSHEGEYQFGAKVIINSAGLESDNIFSMITTGSKKYELHYCKGDYFRISSAKSKLLSIPVYPVVKKDSPSLGIHATPDLSGNIRLGPDAEYTGTRKIDYSIDEGKKKVFYENVKHFMPFLDEEDLFLDTAGIRPKLQGPGEGFRDFIIKHEAEAGFEGFINLIGIESPGLTAAPAIAEIVAGMVEEVL